MLSVYVPSESTLKKLPETATAALPDNAVWIDLVKPTPEEDHAVERLAGIAVPTREDMQEIEISSRLYIENGARYMTATLMCHSDTDMPRTTAVTFILAGHRLVTVRYDEPKPFALVETQAGAVMPAGDHRRNGADGTARRGDRPLRRHSGARRRRGRPGLPRHLRARKRAPRPRQALFADPDRDRPQGRSDLEGSRKPGLDRPRRHLPVGGRWRASNGPRTCASSSRPCSATSLR